jgi:predicted nucleic acid-binding protein
MAVLVDSNVILDLMTQDERWLDWSTRTLAEIGDRERLLINPIIYGEVSVRFTHIEALEEALPRSLLEREPIPYEAAFLAGKVFQRYRARGGQKTAPLPDFFIGAHAAVAGHGLITRDPKRYRVEFPKVRLIAP